MTLRELVVAYRTEHALSQRQFAIQCGVSNGFIAMLERNLNPKTGQPLVPSIPSLSKIAYGMGMTLSELFASVEDMQVDISSEDDNKEASYSELSDDESKLLWMYRQLNPVGKEYILQTITMATQVYKQKDTDFSAQDASAG